MAKITVEFAVYGALAHGDENIAEAKDVKSILENLINTKDGIVKIDNKNMGGVRCTPLSRPLFNLFKFV